MVIESRAIRWVRLYDEVDRANVLLHDVKSRLSGNCADKGQLAQDLERLTRRSNAALEALHDAYRSASREP